MLDHGIDLTQAEHRHRFGFSLRDPRAYRDMRDRPFDLRQVSNPGYAAGRLLTLYATLSAHAEDHLNAPFLRDLSGGVTDNQQPIHLPPPGVIPLKYRRDPTVHGQRRLTHWLDQVAIRAELICSVSHNLGQLEIGSRLQIHAAFKHLRGRCENRSASSERGTACLTKECAVRVEPRYLRGVSRNHRARKPGPHTVQGCPWGRL